MTIVQEKSAQHLHVCAGLLPCVFLLVGLPFIPESPRWLVWLVVTTNLGGTWSHNGKYSHRPELLVTEMNVPKRIFSFRYIHLHSFLR